MIYELKERVLSRSGDGLGITVDSNFIIHVLRSDPSAPAKAKQIDDGGQAKFLTLPCYTRFSQVCFSPGLGLRLLLFVRWHRGSPVYLLTKPRLSRRLRFEPNCCVYSGRRATWT